MNKGINRRNRCVECRRLLTDAAVQLTAKAAMCRQCYTEAVEACREEREVADSRQRAAYCPEPDELWRRIEAARAKLGSAPLADSRTKADAASNSRCPLRFCADDEGMNTASPRLLTHDETAGILRLTPRQVARLANAGRLPTVRLPGGEVRIDERDLWQWIERHKQLEGTSDAS